MSLIIYMELNLNETNETLNEINELMKQFLMKLWISINLNVFHVQVYIIMWLNLPKGSYMHIFKSHFSLPLNGYNNRLTVHVLTIDKS